MKLGKTITVGLAFATAGLVGSPSWSDDDDSWRDGTVVVHQRGSGFSWLSEAFNLNGDEFPGEVALFKTKGSLGRVESVFRGDLIFDGSPCVLDGGVPGLTLLFHPASTASDRLGSGDIFFRALSASPPSTACIDPAEQLPGEWEIYFDVTGGIGRFSEASGNIVARGRGNGAYGFELTLEGEIHNVKRKRSRRDDD